MKNSAAIYVNEQCVGGTFIFWFAVYAKEFYCDFSNDFVEGYCFVTFTMIAEE